MSDFKPTLKPNQSRVAKIGNEFQILSNRFLCFRSTWWHAKNGWPMSCRAPIHSLLHCFIHFVYMCRDWTFEEGSKFCTDKICATMLPTLSPRWLFLPCALHSDHLHCWTCRQRLEEEEKWIRFRIEFFCFLIKNSLKSNFSLQIQESLFKSKHRLDFSWLQLDPRGRQLIGYGEQELSNKGGYELVHCEDLAYMASAHQERKRHLQCKPNQPIK